MRALLRTVAEHHAPDTPQRKAAMQLEQLLDELGTARERSATAAPTPQLPGPARAASDTMDAAIEAPHPASAWPTAASPIRGAVPPDARHADTPA